jgi:hypothetical protein
MRRRPAAIRNRRFATALGALAFEANGDLTPDSEEWTRLPMA